MGVLSVAGGEGIDPKFCGFFHDAFKAGEFEGGKKQDKLPSPCRRGVRGQRRSQACGYVNLHAFFTNPLNRGFPLPIFWVKDPQETARAHTHHVGQIVGVLPL
jgi:hypothetical protein